MTEQTLSIIKPDAVARDLTGEILGRLEKAGLKIVALKMARMTKAQAEGFYAVHQERPFFGSLTDYMSSGPCVISILEGEDAIKKYRDLMGPTDPAKAEKGTIRGDLGVNLEQNSTHGSDAPETAAFEMGYCFNGFEQR